MRRAWVIALAAACGSDVSSVEQASTQQCPGMTVEGLDVYAGQGTIDWAKVKASGRDFAFIKASQGDYNKQSTFAANWANSQANGVLRSAYHFFDPQNDGVAQAHWFLAELAGAGGMTATDLPPLLDIECPTSSNQAMAQPNCMGNGTSGWVPTATMQQRIFDWLDTVEAATGRKAILYSYPSWFGDLQFTDPRLTNYPLFIASYNSCATVPAPWQQAIFWQYSASATVPGISGNVDVDRFFGSDVAGWNGTTVMHDAGVGNDAIGDPVPDAPGNGATGAGAGCGCRALDPRGALLVVVVIGLVRRRSALRRR